MWVFYVKFLSTLLIVEAATIDLPQKFCNVQSETMTEQCFLREILVTLAHSPNQLAVHKPSNTLYFSFDSGQGEYVPATIKLESKSKNVTVLKGIIDAFAMADDLESDDVYFGGSHGIYKYNAPMKILKRLASVQLDIWWLFIKKKIYFIKFPSLKAFYYQNRTIKPVNQLKFKTVHQFVFDNDDNTFFINSTGLYGIKKDSYDAVLLKDYPKFLGLAVNNKGQIFACSDDAIYIVSKMVFKVKKLLTVPGILGFTFDKFNNIIYSDSHELVRLITVSK